MATIIKGDSRAYATGTPLRPTSFDMSDFTQQAETYLAQVRSEAAKIVQQAQSDAAKVRAQAEEAGRQAAQAEIERILDQKVAQQMRTLRPAIDSAVTQIRDSQAAWEREWEKNVVALACAIAGKIVRQEIRNQPEIPLEWIQSALKLSGSTGQVILRLNPHDLTTLRDQVEGLATSVSPTNPATIVGDESITPGGCRVDTEFGSIDQQLETQLDRIATEFGD